MNIRFLTLGMIFLSFPVFSQKDELREAERQLKRNNLQETAAALKRAEAVLASATEDQQAQYYFLKAKNELVQADSGTDTEKNITDAIDYFNKVQEIENATKSKKYSVQADPLMNQLLSGIVNNAINDNNSGNFKSASKKFEQAYTLSKKDTSYLFYSANAAVNAKDYDFAESKYKELLRLNYTGKTKIYTAVNKATGKIQSFGGDKKMRDVLLRHNTYINPGEVFEESKKGMILKNLAFILMGKENYSEAEAYIIQAYKENPDDTDVLISMMNLYLETNRRDKFEEVALKALEKNPLNDVLLYNMGVVHLNKNEDASAKEYFERAIAVNPKNINAYINLANIVLKSDAEITGQMNSISNTRSNQKKFDELKQKKKEIYEAALSYLKKAESVDAKNEMIQSNIKELNNFLMNY